MEVQMLFGGTELQVFVVEKSEAGADNIAYQTLQSINSWKSMVSSNLELQKYLNLACVFEDEVPEADFTEFKESASSTVFEYGRNLENRDNS